MFLIKSVGIILFGLLVSCCGQQPSDCQDRGDGNYGCFDISSQGSCTQVSDEPPLGDGWPPGIDVNLDWAVKCGDIIAYKLQWFNGAWSDWFVTGVNDLDEKVDVGNGLRRKWRYFADHTHTYIICKTNAHNQLKGCQ